MMRHAARHADVWNTMSFAPTFAEQIAEARERAAAMDARCAKIGRDPSGLRRSFYMEFGAVYESAQAFADFAQQLIGSGFSDLVLTYPRTGDRAQKVLERIAHDVLPQLRAQHPA
jgi:alkanesulfonate monooxygenase SsuD/methylene tetrahydromethanopterin reductase-like flavin-dependent oxidoreductase (luciferase family)